MEPIAIMVETHTDKNLSKEESALVCPFIGVKW